MTVELEIAIIGFIVTLISVVVAAMTLRHMHKKDLRERDDREHTKELEAARKEGAFQEWKEGTDRQMAGRRLDIQKLDEEMVAQNAKMEEIMNSINSRLNGLSDTVSRIEGIIEAK